MNNFVKYKICAVNGIPIYITLFLIQFIGFLTLLAYVTGGMSNAVGLFLTFTLVYFLVTLHELGHSLTAQYFKYYVHDITLWPMAGLASIVDDDWLHKPKHYLWITLNGPLVNYALAIAGTIALYFYPHPWISNFIIINASLFYFNLLPVYPMDGGRIMHLLVQTAYPWASEFQIRNKVKFVSVISALIAAPFLAMNFSYLTAGIVVYMALVMGTKDLQGGRHL